jgi:hypothetical protein
VVRIDIHATVHWVAVPPASASVPPPNHPANLPAHVRSFGACTADLHQLAYWLGQCGVKTGAMESTGIYWIPLFELLESRGFKVYIAGSWLGKLAGFVGISSFEPGAGRIRYWCGPRSSPLPGPATRAGRS